MVSGELYTDKLSPSYVIAQPDPATKLKIISKGETLLEMDLATGECFVLHEGRMPEAAQQFWKHVRYLMGVK